MQELDFVTVAKAHADWKTKLRDAITNKEQIDVETLSQDNLCMLGKWLHDEDTKAAMQDSQIYQECVVHHAHFHTEAAKIAKEINAARYEKAAEMLTSGHPYSQASSEVAICLHELRKEVSKLS